MRFNLKRAAAAVLAALLLPLCALAETTYEPLPWDSKNKPNPPIASCYLPNAAGYHDGSIDVKIEESRVWDTNVMIVRVKISDPTQLRTATAGKFPNAGQKEVARMAKENNAVLAINGDYFGYHKKGIVVRNGKRWRMSPTAGRETLIIDTNGDFTILAPTSREAWDAFGEENVVHAFCFGPGIVRGGQPMNQADIEAMSLSCGKTHFTQRIAIGQEGPLSYIIVYCEGPEQKNSKGLTLLQFSQLCAEVGMIEGYNLDGGSSCTIVLDNKKINAKSGSKKRWVSDCIYFATLATEATK